MTPDEIPRELLVILDKRAGKIHSRGGVVAECLAEILTEYEKLKMTTNELAKLIHDSFCTDNPCKRFGEGDSHPHYNYYHARAEKVESRIGPIIGVANVYEVVDIILDELV
jgi:hypothetical protein